MASNLAPASFLSELVGKRVVVKSKWGPQFEATLISTDGFFNVHLKDCTEHVAGEAADEDEGITMEEVLIRCNNILYIRAVPDGAKATFTPW